MKGLRNTSELYAEILKLTLIDVSILSTLRHQSHEVTRYEVMKRLYMVLGQDQISTGKFYRHLERLHKNGFVEFKDPEREGDDDGKDRRGDKNVMITDLGKKALQGYRSINGTIGLNVLSYFETDLENMLKFIGYDRGNVLFIDFPQIYDLSYLSNVRTNAEKMYFYCPKDVYDWLKKSIYEIYYIDPTQEVEDIEVSFELIIGFQIGGITDMSVLDKVYDLLDVGGKFLTITSEPIEDLDHYVVNILVSHFWPFGVFDESKSPEVTEYLSKYADLPLTRTMSQSGLELKIYEKTG